MNRRLTGWLAWGALALVIGVPSADIVFSGADDDKSVVIGEVDDGLYGPAPLPEPLTSVVGPTIVDAFEAPFADRSPLLADVAPSSVADEAPISVAAQLPKNSSADELIPQVADVAVAEAFGPFVAADQLPVVEPSQLADVGVDQPGNGANVEVADMIDPDFDELETIETAAISTPDVDVDIVNPVEVAEIEQPVAPVPMTKSFQPVEVAKQVRVVGDPGAVVTPKIISPVELEVETAGLEVEDEIAAPTIIHVADEPVTTPDLVTPPSVVVKKPVVVAKKPIVSPLPVIELASVDTGAVSVVEGTRILAPIPMPAAMRPPEPIVVASAPETLQHVPFVGRASTNDGRSRVNQPQSGSIVNIPVFEAESTIENNRGFVEQEPLEDFNIGDFSIDEDDGGFGFTQKRRRRPRTLGFFSNGSFEEQIPARRGNGVRMDLLQ